MILYGSQNIDENDIEEVIKVLRSEYLTQGPKVTEFEKSVSNYCGSKYAVSVNSATSALHIACKALGVGKGHIVWTTVVSFVASANCALYCEANIDFIDIDLDTLNLSIEALENKLEEASKKGILPNVLIAVHMTGRSCNMIKIHELSKKYNFRIIEDASHAIGGIYNEKKIGSCDYSDITVFSFHPVKIITTGEGGIATTNDKEIWTQLNLLRSHGITKFADDFQNKSNGGWYYEQVALGYNYRMTDIQAALGISQLKKIEIFLECRRRIAQKYRKTLSDMPLKLQESSYDHLSSWHLFVVQFECQNTRERVYKKMIQNAIGVNLHYIPIVCHPYYQKLGFTIKNYPEAYKYYKSALTLPIHPKLDEVSFELIVNTLKESL